MNRFSLSKLFESLVNLFVLFKVETLFGLYFLLGFPVDFDQVGDLDDSHGLNDLNLDRSFFDQRFGDNFFCWNFLFIIKIVFVEEHFFGLNGVISLNFGVNPDLWLNMAKLVDLLLLIIICDLRNLFSSICYGRKCLILFLQVNFVFVQVTAWWCEVWDFDHFM